MGFQANADGASGYDEAMVTAQFQAYGRIGGGAATLTYAPWQHQPGDGGDGTAFTSIMSNVDNGAAVSGCCELHIFNPASTTYVTKFLHRSLHEDNSTNIVDQYHCGYFNITAAIDEIQFKPASGVFDAVIKLWGIK